jgi:N-acetylgalactosamine-N,N'-diacetylbacillosaminyl-diphospho-undecaprenol 4-alpha-N-acetylgalactosaminyltransferase
VIEYDIPTDVTIIDLKQSEKDNQFLTLLKLPILSYRLSRYCKKNNINHSVAFLNRPCYINALMRNWWGYKGRIVVCERTHQSTMLQTKSWLNRRITKFLVKYAYRNANLVLANSQAMKADLERNLQVTTPIKVIYNPIDIGELQVRMNEAVPIHFTPGTFYFISVGNFRKEKNYPLLLDAFAGIHKPNCKLLLVGGGYMEDVLKQKVDAMGMKDRVIFCGKDNNPFKYLRHGQCFVMCSDVEGFPNVLLEAIACGKAVISTDCKIGPT